MPAARSDRQGSVGLAGFAYFSHTSGARFDSHRTDIQDVP
jgi:hypothetical protein